MVKKDDAKRASAKKADRKPSSANKKKPQGAGDLPQTMPQGQISSEERAESSKYYAGPVMQKFEGVRGFELPGGYGDNRIVLLVRDPYWVYSYWEINPGKREQIRKEVGDDVFGGSSECLRVYNVDNWDSFDIDNLGGANNWHINVPQCNVSYCVDIGFKTPDGRFIAAARSNIVTTPLDRMSDVIDEKWMIPDWDKMYSLSGGFGIGKSSAEIREMMKKRLTEESASGWVSSMGSPVRKIGERPFWMWAEAEVILYGATEPTATLSVQGRKVALRPDGTFTLRYALPDGVQTFPIEAVQDDGAARKKTTIEVDRKTKQ
jgi:hypothetical protein